MKKLFFLMVLFCGLKVNAQNYLITFTGTGASTTVTTVKVENLMKGTALTLNGNDILCLTAATGVNSINDNNSYALKIYPNPMTDNSTLEVSPPVAGNVVITVYEMTGKPIAQIQNNLENVRQDYRISGIKNGLYIINVKGNNYQISGILLSNSKSNGTIKIEKVNSIIQAVDEKVVKTNSKGTPATSDMAYSSGDRLKFTGISGNFSTVITDIPTSDKTVNFNFVFCSDRDNNNYPVVVIGTQTWMAENLKTTKYRDGSTAIPLVTGNTDWYNLTSPGYCWYDNNIANKDTFGALYNWYTVNTGNLCPTGWHVPTDAEWTTLTNYLGSESVAAGKLKETGTTHWSGPNTGSTNETGFTALPDGGRDDSGAYYGVENYGNWWSSTEYSGTDGWIRYMHYNSSNVVISFADKRYGFSVRCLKGMLTTIEASSITQTSAISGGNVPSDFGETVTARGVCWNTSGNPTIADNNTNDGTSTGIFTSSITGLTENTIYYVRAYATTSFGTSYGSQVSFATTGHSGTVTDFEGNIYKTITIGSQIWMAENLKTTKYNDGTAIPNVTDDGAWAALTTGAYSDYNNTPANSTTYGRLYNWYSVDNNASTKVASNGGKNVCPTGWHVPSDAEWTTLTTYLGGESVAGGKLKETGTAHWLSPNTGATNETGFTALPGGYRGSSSYMHVGILGFWWSSTKYSSTSAWYRVVFYDNRNDVYRSEWFKQCGFSVRCVKD